MEMIEGGVVHRDLELAPVTLKGKAKVLDFGLPAMVQGSSSGPAMQTGPFGSDRTNKKNLASTTFPNRLISVKLFVARLRNKRVFRGNPGTLFASHL